MIAFAAGLRHAQREQMVARTIRENPDLFRPVRVAVMVTDPTKALPVSTPAQQGRA